MSFWNWDSQQIPVRSPWIYGAAIEVSPELSKIGADRFGQGTWGTVPMGEMVTGEDWEVTVLDTWDDAWIMAQEANQFNDPPEEGLEYLALRLRALATSVRWMNPRMSGRLTDWG